MDCCEALFQSGCQKWVIRIVVVMTFLQLLWFLLLLRFLRSLQLLPLLLLLWLLWLLQLWLLRLLQVLQLWVGGVLVVVVGFCCHLHVLHLCLYRLRCVHCYRCTLYFRWHWLCRVSVLSLFSQMWRVCLFEKAWTTIASARASI